MRSSMLIAVLLLLYSVICSVGVTAMPYHRCIHDLMVPHVPVVTVPRTVPNKTELTKYTNYSTEWTPLRISFFMDETDEHPKYCKNKDSQVKSIFAWNETKITCSDEDVLTPEKKQILLESILPAAVKMHTDRLTLRRLNLPLIVPEFNTTSVCGKFTIPEGHKSTGLTDTDMVLYISALPTRKAVRAWALTCATMLVDKRPIVGVLNYAPKYITDTPYSIRVAAHEIAHTLGFSFAAMQYDHGMVKTKTDVRGKPLAMMVSSPHTKSAAVMHYNCTNATGMELEDEKPWPVGFTNVSTAVSGSEKKIPANVGHLSVRNVVSHSHWKRRNAKDELMAGILGAGHYTALTLGAFQDMKYFRANFSKAETMPWGRKAGCKLLTDKCVKSGATEYPDMFCTSVPSTDSRESFQCTSDRMALGKCSAKTHDKELPQEFQYFDEKKQGGLRLSLMDYCPIIVPENNMWCADGSADIMPGSRIGHNARCFTGDGLKSGETTLGGVCAEVRCMRNGTMAVRHSGDDGWHACPSGGSIDVKTQKLTGKIQCPPFATLCNELNIEEEEEVMPAEPEIAQPPKTEDHPRGVTPTTDATTGAPTDNKEKKNTDSTAVFAALSHAALLILAAALFV